MPLEVFAAAVEAGAANPDRTQLPQALEVGELLQDLLGDRADGAPDYPPRLAGIALNAWASVLGYLVAEIFGSLRRLIADTDRLFCAHVRTVMLGMGFDPARIQTVDQAVEARHHG